MSDMSLLTVFDVLLHVTASGATEHLMDAHAVAVSEKRNHILESPPHLGT